MLELNLKTKAASQTTLPFNSMCKFGSSYLGATSAGLHTLGGYNDHGVAIPALIKSGNMDFGSTNNKRFRFFYFGLETDGNLLLKVYCDKVLAAEQYTVAPAETTSMRVRVPISRVHQSRYWSWSVENVSGAFMALYSVEALPLFLHPGRG